MYNPGLDYLITNANLTMSIEISLLLKLIEFTNTLSQYFCFTQLNCDYVLTLTSTIKLIQTKKVLHLSAEPQQRKLLIMVHIK